jgi:hypothetical protein
LEVRDVVQHGTGPGSRFDLTITYEGRRRRLRSVPAKQVPSYKHVTGFAMEEGLLLPSFSHGDRVWRKALAPAMKEARVEPWREGEEITRAIAAEIRSLLESSHGGERGCDFSAGQVVVEVDELFVRPAQLVLAVRRRMVDDVLPRAVIADAARRHLEMYPTRRRLIDDKRFCWWAFPAAALAWREAEDRPFEEAPHAELFERTQATSPIHDTFPHDENDGTNGVDSIPSMDGEPVAASFDGRERYEPEPLDGEDATGILDRSMDGPLGMVSFVTPGRCSDGPNGRSKNFPTGERDEGRRTKKTGSILSRDGGSAGASLHGREGDERDGSDGEDATGILDRSMDGPLGMESIVTPGRCGNGPSGRRKEASPGSHVAETPKEVVLAGAPVGRTATCEDDETTSRTAKIAVASLRRSRPNRG